MSPQREGFTLVISMLSQREQSNSFKTSLCSQTAETNNLAIAAIRILVGSLSSNLIPRSLKVMGRMCELVASKRWYTYHLSAQELAFSIRNGFVSVEIDECLDSTSCPTLDSVEVYAIERRKIERWFPTRLQSFAAVIALDGGCVDAATSTASISRECFRLSIQTLARLNSLFGPIKPNRTEKAFLKQLVQETALGNDQEIVDAVAGLLPSHVHDEESRQSFHDKAVLAGCTVFLTKCQRSLEALKGTENRADFRRTWHSLIPSLRSCLQTAARIARLRPFNYFLAADGSIAADAGKFINDCLSRSISDYDLVSDFVELSLLESAVANGTPRGRFGSFDGLRYLLSSPNHAVVSQTCASISRFCRVCDIFTSQTMAVKYVCDSCLLFINDTRYTLLDSDHTFDLCPDCYSLGHEYSKSAKCEDNDNVFIKGKTVGESPKLTCHEVQIMQPVAIYKAATDDDAFCREIKVKDKTTYRLPQHPQPVQIIGAEIAHQQQLFNDFMDGLFTGIAGLLGEELMKLRSTPSSLVWLCVDLVRHSIQSGRKRDQANVLASAMGFGLRARIEATMSGVGSLLGDCPTLLDGLTSIFAKNQGVREYLLGIHKNFVAVENDGSGIVCCTHGAPAALFKITRGQDKDRCFFGCAEDIKRRCEFFVWADKGAEVKAVCPPFSDDIATFVWQLLTSVPTNGGTPLHLSLCAFVDKFCSQNGNYSSDSKNSQVLDYCRNLENGFADGVLCSYGRLRGDYAHEILSSLLRRPRAADARICASDAESVVIKSLELISLVASPDMGCSTEWFPTLCRIVLSVKVQVANSDNLRSLAKRCLAQLCGKNTRLLHAVRDHFSFAFHCDKLFRCAEGMLSYSVRLNEKARQCSPDWRITETISFQRMNICDVVGTEDLLSEDVGTLQTNEDANKILCELYSTATKRGSSWRRFCGLRKLPSGMSRSLSELQSDFTTCPPILSLFAVACLVSFENQVKALRLINLALGRPSERKSAALHKQVETDLPKSSDDEKDMENSVGIAARLPFIYIDSTTPEEILNVSIGDVHAFVVRFVCRGNSSEIRNLSSNIAMRLCYSLDQTSQRLLFDSLMGRPLSRAGGSGKRCAEFLALLQSLLRGTGSKFIDVNSSAAVVQTCLKQQIIAIRHDRSNCEFLHFETRFSSSVQKKRYDLAACSSCRVHESRAKGKNGEEGPFTSSSVFGPSSTSGAGLSTLSPSKAKWLTEQVSPFARVRLDAGRDSVTSKEFCSYFSLKNRCVVSAIHAEVENPRRHVKTINVFFSPRPVEDVIILKSDEFAEIWQPCGVLTLSRDCSSASLTLDTPVVAANLKVEYADFYERPGGTKATDGSLIVHCPRCTRVVTNAHGVCAHCGEVAFQCRKCRHINYDRLDAFLCVECGFCASGGFVFDLTAAVATNAVAITNDHDFENASRRATEASRLYDELRSSLKEKLLGLVPERKKGSLDVGKGEDQEMEMPAALIRAFQGALPLVAGEDHNRAELILSKLGKPGSIVKTIAHLNRKNADRPLSFYRSSRRTESLRSSRTEGLLMRGFGGDRDMDEDETASELLGGLLESTNGLARYAGLDPNDPLSRLLASVQSRRVRREADQREQVGATAAPAPSGTSAKETLDVCDRLYVLMREAEREAHELERRCAAWSRLVAGRLAETGDDEQPTPGFEPSHCSVCAVTIASHLLFLWLRLFQLNPDSVVIDQEMITLLLHEDSAVQSKNLQDSKRTAVKEIALHSKQGSHMVLEALRLRLTLLKDVNAAEILGKILDSVGADSVAAAPFVSLAREALESGLS